MWTYCAVLGTTFQEEGRKRILELAEHYGLAVDIRIKPLQTRKKKRSESEPQVIPIVATAAIAPTAVIRMEAKPKNAKV
jgi:hypothetical protein